MLKVQWFLGSGYVESGPRVIEWRGLITGECLLLDTLKTQYDAAGMRMFAMLP